MDPIQGALTEARLLLKQLNQKPKKVTYAAVKGDAVDQALAKLLQEGGYQVPIDRKGAGVYMVGTKRVTMSLINGKFMVRVGGGYMPFNEFMAHYGKMEMAKLGIKVDDHGKTIDDGDEESKGGDDEDDPFGAVL